MKMQGRYQVEFRLSSVNNNASANIPAGWQTVKYTDSLRIATGDILRMRDLTNNPPPMRVRDNRTNSIVELFD